MQEIMLNVCRAGVTADAIGWLEFGADGRWRHRGGFVRTDTHTKNTNTRGFTQVQAPREEVRPCRRIGLGTRRISRGKESSKGLNTESNKPQRATAMVLVGLAGGEHCREEHTVLPRFRALLER